MWATDSMNGGLVDLDWPTVKTGLTELRSAWTEQLIAHAESQNVFFPEPGKENLDARIEWEEHKRR